jgi:thiamine-phosphate pyrophosphorylase
VKKVDISLYAILDPARARARPLPDLARAAVDGGATLLQYRDKMGGVCEQVKAIGEIRKAISGTGVPLIVNDHPEIARAAGAQGVHLGSSDMAPDAARALLGGDAIIGMTVKTLEEARGIALDCADYVFVGGVFATKSKHNPVSVGLAGWQTRAAILRKRQAGLPVGAIAGISLDNVADVIAAGADGIAVIGAIFSAGDVEGAARNLKDAIERAQRDR